MKIFKRITTILIVLFLMNSVFSYSKKNLLEAVQANSKSQISKILTMSPELSTLKYGDDGNSILMIALQYKCSDDIIEMILKAGCSPDLKNKNGQTALMFAANYGASSKTINRIVNFNTLTKAGKIKRITTKDNMGSNAFDYAKENPQVYNALEEYVLDPAKIKKEPESQMPKQASSEQNNTNEQKEQIKENSELKDENQPEIKSEQKQTPKEEISIESEQNQEFITELENTQIESELEQNKKNENPQKLETENNFETISELENKQIEPKLEQNKKNENPQKLEPETENNFETISELENTQIEPELEQNIQESEVKQELELSSQELTTFQEETSKTTISSPIEIPKIDQYSNSRPEYLFDEIETESVVKEDLLDDIKTKKVQIISNPDAVDNNKRTRLMNSIMENDYRTCYALLESGANPNAKDNDGWTPLMYACRYSKSPAIIQMLFEYGAELDTKTYYDITVLQIAAAYCQNKNVLANILSEASKKNLNILDSFIFALMEERPEEIIREYFNFNIKINSIYKGKTPLMYAAEYYETTNVIKLLLEKGADPYIVSVEKKNAFSYAKENPKIVHDSIYWSLNVSNSKKR